MSDTLFFKAPFKTGIRPGTGTAWPLSWKRPASGSPRPGLLQGLYPERRDPVPTWLERAFAVAEGVVARPGPGTPRRFRRILGAIERHGQQFEHRDRAGLRQCAATLRKELHREGLTRDLTAQAFALVRELAGRTLGMRHFDSQLIGGWALVHGMLAEMETGAGKTLTATLAAATAGLAGIPVHVITVNDYLASRDAERMGPLYRALGLSVGTVTAELDTRARREAYACDIAYCTNKQVAFDYLRDRILLGNDNGRLRLRLERLHHKEPRLARVLLRGLCFAVVDEADSVLIDEARTPLIVSREGKALEDPRTYRQALDLADRLSADADFLVQEERHEIRLTEPGRTRLDRLAVDMGTIWNGARRREELVRQALSARYLYHRDRHYLVRDGKVQIVDENTGRVMPDRAWEGGLQQMIETKEACEITGLRHPLARLTYQRFFRRYLRLSGMTGTAHEVRRELWSTYRLRVLNILPHHPSRRWAGGQRVYADKVDKWAAVLERVRMLRQEGRPMLVGTRTVADSDRLSRLLTQAGLPHQVLNARQDAREAGIVATAGARGRITVATNMAGRGTDIPLGEGVVARGGLHVISTERNEARRIDRQLFGRCGRQGDPGSYEAFLSLDDELVRHHGPAVLRRLLGWGLRRERPLAQWLALRLLALAQERAERRHWRMRRDLLQQDRQLGRLLAFSGRME